MSIAAEYGGPRSLPSERLLATKGKRMEFTNRETWTLIHGLILGTFPARVRRRSRRPLESPHEYITAAGIRERLSSEMVRSLSGCAP
jgi:hypothetical protein